MSARHEEETGFLSNVSLIMRNENMRQIISLGEDVIPLILYEMGVGGGSVRWISAMREIIGQDPLAGDIELQSLAWWLWGEKQLRLFGRYIAKNAGK